MRRRISKRLPARRLMLGLALALCALYGQAQGETLLAEPGQMLEPRADDSAASGGGWHRAASRECRACIKECLGGKITTAQQASIKYQTPVSLISWYLFRNRPFRMYPMEDAVASLAGIPPAAYASVGAAAYMICSDHCELECSFPHRKPRSEGTPIFPELADPACVPEDFGPIGRFLRPSQPKRRRGGAVRDAFSHFFSF